MLEIKSVEYSGNLQAKLNGVDMSGSQFLLPREGLTELPEAGEGLNLQTVNFSLDFAGASDVLDLNNPKSSFALSNIQSNAVPAEQTNFGLEVKQLKDVLYMQLTSMPSLGIIDLSFLAGQWVKIDFAAIREQLRGTATPAEASPEPEKKNFQPKILKKLNNLLEKAR